MRITMVAEKFTRMEKEWIRMSMPADHGETAFRLLLRPQIVDLLEFNLNVNDVLETITTSGLITVSECEKIRTISSNSDKLRLLLEDINSRGGPGTVETFLACLREEHYDHAAFVVHAHLRHLYSAATDSARDIQIKSGLIPTQPEFYVVRRELVYRIKDAIISASEQANIKQTTHWILMHGMPGNGKSYLAAAALRSPEIWKVCFADGVYWLDIGKPGADKLLIKLRVLCQMLGVKPLLDATLSDQETICQTLAHTFAHKHPNSALVLDDVWDESVIRAFEKVACKCIIVTSRKRDVTHHIKATVSQIEISFGFTENESQNYFAQILKTSISELPKEAVLIHQKTKGLPMVTALFGGMLRDHSNDAKKWKHYLEKLVNTPEKVMGMVGSSTYQNQSIDEAIALSVKSLKLDLRERFFDFAIFDDDVPIPQSVFTILWSIPNDDETEDEMAHFVNSSLCTRDYCPTRRCKLYRFHDLILLYARNHLPISTTKKTSEKKTFEKEKFEKNMFEKNTSEKNTFEKNTFEKNTFEKEKFEKNTSEKNMFEEETSDFFSSENEMSEKEIQAARANALQDKHRKLFIKYYAVCQGRFEDLADDFYIHNFVGYHLSWGKLMSDIKQLYENRAFFEKRILYAGPEVVLVDLLLLRKQHPVFSEQLIKLEEELKSKFRVNVLSPDVQSRRRRSFVFEEHIRERSTSVEVGLNANKLTSPEDNNARRTRAQFDDQEPPEAGTSLLSVHSAPVLPTVPSRRPSHSASRLNSRESIQEDKENGLSLNSLPPALPPAVPPTVPPALPPLPKLKMDDLRDDNFDNEW